VLVYIKFSNFKRTCHSMIFLNVNWCFKMEESKLVSCLKVEFHAFLLRCWRFDGQTHFAFLDSSLGATVEVIDGKEEAVFMIAGRNVTEDEFKNVLKVSEKVCALFFL
jgi:hypothetical protein